jgi:class 3 adenylate cyclase
MDTVVEEVAIVFADVTGSVRLFDALGDERAWKLIQKCLKGMTEEIDGHQGRVIKTIGDEVMCTFSTADDAVNAAVAMQERVRDDSIGGDSNEPALAVRIGIHYGEVIPKDDDVFGDAVNLASRIATAAKGGQIITTQFTTEVLSASLKYTVRLVDRMPVKGKRDPIDIYEVVWEEGTTNVATNVVNSEDMEARLSLRYRDKVIVMNHTSTPMMLGRGRQAHLRVDDANASRIHLRVEYSRGKFMIFDESINGTYVLTPAGEVTLRRNEFHVLSGTGQISLGRKVDDNEEIVHYECESG